MKNLLVSIVIPVYNSEAFLDKCIQSVINQSYKNIEIILVNDGSTDTSKEICNNYALTDSRIKVIHKINGGLVSSRKTGLKLSTGDFILYIDGDDWIELNLIEDYINQILKFNADIVISSHIVNLEGRIDILPNTIPPGVYNKDKLKSIVYPKMLYTGNFSQFGIFSYSWGKLYRRELLLKNQLSVTEDITIGEDALCLYPTLLDANTLVILEQPYYHYRQRADSLIKTLRTIDISKMEKVYNDLKKIFYDRGVLDIMLPQLQYYLLSLLTINTEGPNTDDTTNLYPFNNVKSGANLVICGGGTFGQHLYKKINNYKSHNVVAWVDKKHEHYSKLNLPVTGFDQIKSLEYDAVLIALIDEDNSNQAYSKLIEHGVNKNKIIQISHYNKKENVQELLLKFKINL
jgi:glycosyltransferase involved in cell wall biosynthesis